MLESVSNMSAIEPPSAPSYRLIQWAPLAIALALVFSMMSATQEWLYVAAAVGVVASIAVGRTSGNSAAFPLPVRLWKFAQGWLLVVGLASLSLLHGKWEPMVFFALVGGVSLAFFWIGCRSIR